MFSFFKKKTQATSVPAVTQKLTLTVSGMHCSSCGMNIDGELEELPGVQNATTSYAKSQTTIDFDATKTSAKDIEQAIESLGYTIKK